MASKDEMSSADNSGKVELRGEVPIDLMRRLDAVSQAKGYSSRLAYLIPIIERELEKEVHAATVLCRMVGVNPLASGAAGKEPE